jgi:hypothetical protein
VATSFFVSIPRLSKLGSGCQQKSPDALHQGFFFVVKRFEIANLLNGIYDIIGLSEILSDTIKGM